MGLPTGDQALMFGEVPWVSGWSVTSGPSFGRDEGTTGPVELRDGSWATALPAYHGRGRTAPAAGAGRRRPRAAGRRPRARHGHRSDRAPEGERTRVCRSIPPFPPAAQLRLRDPLGRDWVACWERLFHGFIDQLL